MAYEAVRVWLTDHPDELSRSHRYLIIQGLRAIYPCKATDEPAYRR